MPLTDTAVRQAKPQEKDYSISDSAGLFMFVSTKGSKAWHFRFSWHGKQPRISLGTYPEITLKDARERRDQARALVAKGIDPRIARRDEKIKSGAAAANTFEVVANRWHEFKLPRWAQAKKGAANQSRFYLDKDLIPELGHTPMAELTRADMLRALRRVEKRGALNSARKCRSWLNEICRFAMAEGLIDINPAADLDIVAEPEPPVRHNPMLRAGELRGLLVALRNYQGARYVQAAIRILLLTCVRGIELRSATIDQVDYDAALWTIPPEVVKQLKKVIRRKGGDEIPPYIVPLSRQAIEEMQLVHKLTGGYRMLIAGRNDPRKSISDGTINAALKRMGFEGLLTGHGIRATISTALNEKGWNEDWVEAQLSHAGSSKTRKTYNHAEYVAQRREMMQDWADYLDEVEFGPAQDARADALPAAH
ncbi:integrase arm-type DNA-binding domain-containing protein [Pseudomonas gingeri]|uniref:tyrosine-type recombinase/integrase n=1 Tax=Pseudomonas gingeri TaxID=117681 RepID=UPI0015A0267E|nr:integrase arm-type DNA-binding domain-containing protein [Pseudomonas gingeri]NVZ61218.1 integrase arm-type DNA-binding domain-containing protein [Pseudomonas gingeri]NVZ73771.1 integrase arm-type DNA-binding domain-containing protein [Pseudomonas gingeri]